MQVVLVFDVVCLGYFPRKLKPNGGNIRLS